jgi:hypothetical protein
MKITKKDILKAIKDAERGEANDCKKCFIYHLRHQSYYGSCKRYKIWINEQYHTTYYIDELLCHHKPDPKFILKKIFYRTAKI